MKIDSKIIFQELEDWALSQKPIFIVGPARSGTSLMQLILASHEKNFSIEGVSETFIFQKPSQAMFDGMASCIRYIGGRDNYQRLCSTVASSLSLNNAYANNLEMVFALRMFFKEAQVYYNNSQIIEKTPSHLFKINLIEQVFPSAMFVCMIRDPLKVINSYAKRLQRSRDLGLPPESYSWLEIDEITILERLQQCSKEIYINKDKSNFTVCYYEQLIGCPLYTLGRLGKFFDLNNLDLCIAPMYVSRDQLKQDPRLSESLTVEPPNTEPKSFITLDDVSPAHAKHYEIINELRSAFGYL